eukprot:gb/GEZN01011714.1/.p1 GENE.gb/GEZN01011714.1/~~gb/GEZN01011714.1/.p1  ORF type:complete len:263 (-),score=40.51 gb/GEZN01011714.1/:346-1113(-)
MRSLLPLRCSAQAARFFSSVPKQGPGKTILLTGFGPWGSSPVNPAEKVAKALNGVLIGDFTIVSVITPSSFVESLEVVKAKLEQVHPAVVVMLGEYPGRAALTVERLAQNLNDSARYGLSDSNHFSTRDLLTAPDGPAAYYTTLPIRAMVKAMRAAGVPADISDTAGTFWGNHLMYGILHHLSAHKAPGTSQPPSVRTGWIHLPALPEVVALKPDFVPSMSAETSTKGVHAALEAIVKQQDKGDISDAIPSRLQI